MKKLFTILFLLVALRGFGAFSGGPATAAQAITVRPNGLNLVAAAVTAANARASAHRPQVVYLDPGVHTNHTSMTFSPYVNMVGAGRLVTTLVGSNTSTMIVPGDNSYFGRFSAISLQSNATVSVFGQGDGTTSVTNCVVEDVYFSGDWDALYSIGGQFFAEITDPAQRIDFYNSTFSSRYDTIYLDDGNGGFETAQLRWRFFSCIFDARGAPLKLSSWPGEVGNVKIVGTNTVAEFFGCKWIQTGGTNLTTGVQVDRGGTAILHNPVFETTTNGLVGGAATRAEAYDILCTNNTGFTSTVIVNGATPTNKIAGDGVFRYVGRGNQASSANAVATAANTTETDLMSYTIPASTFHSTNQAVELLAWGSFGATANNKDVRVKIGGVSVLDTLPRANNAQEWMLQGTVQRVSETAMKSFMRFEVTGFVTNDYTSLTLTSSTNIVLRITGSNHVAAASDIVLEGWKLKWVP